MSRPNDGDVPQMDSDKTEELIEDAMHDDPSGQEPLGNKTHNISITRSLRKYFTYVSGKTMNSHEHFKTFLQREVPDLQEVSSQDQCDFFLAFCPIVSRAGTDIELALKNLSTLKTSGSKPAVIVVLHHTFDIHRVVSNSSRIVDRKDTVTVDCLFSEDTGLLRCPKNDEAIKHVKDWIQSQVGEEEESQVKTQGSSLLDSITYGWNMLQSILSYFTGRKMDSECPESDSTKRMCGFSEMVLATKLRLVLLGRTGSGKSAAGNTILGREERSQTGTSTETQQSESRQEEVAGRKVTVVDTPDWFCPEFLLEKMSQDVEFRTCLSTSGPQAFLLVIPVKQSAGEQRGMLEKMEKIFGERCWRNTMILFTVTDEEQKENIDVFVQSENQEISKLVEKCGNRFHCLNIKERGDGTQVSELMEKIEKNVEGNRETSEIYKMISDKESEREKSEITKGNVICNFQKTFRKIDECIKMHLNKGDFKMESDQRKSLTSLRRASQRTIEEGKVELERIRAEVRKLNERLVGTEEEKLCFKVTLPESQQPIWLAMPSKQDDFINSELKEIETKLAKLNESLDVHMQMGYAPVGV